MGIEPYDIIERFAIMTIDGGLSDIEAMRLLLRRFPPEGKMVAAWNMAMRQAKGIDPAARLLFEKARERAIAMTRR